MDFRSAAEEYKKRLDAVLKDQRVLIKRVGESPPSQKKFLALVLNFPYLCPDYITCRASVGGLFPLLHTPSAM